MKNNQLKIIIPFLILSLYSNCVFAVPEFEITGSARVRYESKSNKDFNESAKDYQSFVGSRVLLNLSLKKDDKYNILFQPQLSQTWGERDTDGNVTSGGLNDPAVKAHQAYLRYSLSEELDLTLGRQELAYGDHLLIGNVGWSNVGRSFDAIKFNHQANEFINIDLFYSSLDETNASSPSSGDKSIAGIYGSSSLHDVYFKNFDLYYFQQSDHTTAIKKSVAAYGTRIKSDMGAFDYRFEATFENIDDSSLAEDGSANQFDVEFGYDFPTTTKIHISAEYFQSSEFFDQLLPTGHKWLGFADMFSRKNISGYKTEFSGSFSEQIDIRLSYHQFLRTKEDISAYNFTGGAYGTVGNDDDIAQEYDLVFAYKDTESLSYTLGGSLVTPGNYLKQNGYVDNMEFLYLQILMSL